MQGVFLTLLNEFISVETIMVYVAVCWREELHSIINWMFSFSSVWTMTIMGGIIASVASVSNIPSAANE